MTHDERISSYIDNELSGEQEQEFLISLAASDALRKSFRSELVLKKVLHHDEMATNPPRRLRGAVFAAVGLAGAGIAGAGMAPAHAAPVASSASGLVKSLFATKMSTLITAAGISLSAVAGYGVHTVIAPKDVAPVQSVQAPRAIPAASDQVTPVDNTMGVKQDVGSSQAEHAPATVLHQRAAQTAASRNSARVKASESTTTPAGPVSGAAGGGTIQQDPPVVNGK